jgi:hypothetical protein
MSNKFYYFEENDLIAILDKVYEEGWSGSLELKESFISDVLKESCKKSEVSIKSKNIGMEGKSIIYMSENETTSITNNEFENPQMLLNFEAMGVSSDDFFAKDDVSIKWTTNPSSSWSGFHSDGIKNLNNQWRIK